MNGDRLMGAVFDIISVYPSGAARATSAAPMVAPAPGLLSTTIGCPSFSVSNGPNWRATTSLDPPGGKVTTILMALVGYDWATAAPVMVNARAATQDRARKR